MLYKDFLALRKALTTQVQKYHIFETELHFAFPTMLQSVAWLSFSVFGGSLKIENWKLQSIFNFCFSAKTLKIVDRTTQEGGGGVHSHGNVFAPSALSPDPLPSMRILFFCPFPPSLPSHATFLWKGRSGKFVFTAQSLFQTWTTSVLSTLRIL